MPCHVAMMLKRELLPVDYSLEWDKIKRLGKEFEERFMKARQEMNNEPMNNEQMNK